MAFTFDQLTAVLSLAALPLHGLTLRALVKCQQYFSRSFYYVILHLCICHIIASIISIAGQSGNLYVVRHYLTEHPTYDWIFGIVTSFHGTVAKWAMQTFLAIVAVNRALAIARPLSYHKQKITVIKTVCFLNWIIFILVRLPVIFFFNLQPFHPLDAPDITIYTVGKGQIVYIWIGLVVGLSTLLIGYVCYGYILVKVCIFGTTPIQPAIRRSIVVAFVSSIGLFLMNFVELAEEITWRIWEVNFVQTNFYYLLVNTGYEWSVFSLPVSIIIMFPEVRSYFLYMLYIKDTMITNVVTISTTISNPTYRRV